MSAITLSKAALPAQNLLTKAAMVLGGTALIALAAQVSVGFPVPMTLQTLAIAVIALSFGGRLALVTLLAYIAEGAMGLPVFSNGGAGIAKIMGPTGGFILGFALMAWVTGALADRGMVRSFGGAFVAAALGSAVLYIPGTIWLAAVTGMAGDVAIAKAVTPFLVGDAIKAALAAMIVVGGWKLLRR